MRNLPLVLLISAAAMLGQQTPPLIPQGPLRSASEACDGMVANESEASKIWSGALEARGGLKRLEAVESLVRIQNSDSKDDPSYVELFVLPNRLWSWSDTRPSTEFGGLAISVYNGDSQKAWLTRSEDSSSPQGMAAPPEAYELNMLQASLLLGHSRYFRPRPTHFSKGVDGKLDVVCATEGNHVFKFHIDTETHYIRKVQVFGRWRTGAFGELLRKNYSAYEEIGGMKLPTKESDLDRDPDHTRAYSLRLNVAYDPKIFTRPGSLSDGPFTWTKR